MPARSSDVAEVTALVQAQAATKDRIDAQTAALVTAAVASFRGWYDSEQITEWAVGLAARVEPLQRFLAQMTDGYLARLVTVLSGRSYRPAGEVDVTTLRGATTHAGAYGRVADAYRWQQAQVDAAARRIVTVPTPRPPALQSPIDAALQRALSVAAMDTLLPVRGQVPQTLGDAHERGLVTGYRRVIHPELARSSTTCGLCVAASHRAYHVGDLMPIHHDCHCLPAPIVDGNDPGSVINNADLKRLYAGAGSTGRQDLSHTRYTITNHDELGPVLEPADAPGKRRVQPPGAAGHTPKSPAQRVAAVQRLRDSLVPALSKAEQLANDDPQQWSPLRDSLWKRVAELDAEIKHLSA